MKEIFTSFIYDNPIPRLYARNSAFPYLCELSDGRILAMHQMGQAFESVDGTTCCSESLDGGRTWSKPWRAFDKSRERIPLTDGSKPMRLPGGRLIAMGYQYERPDPEKPIGNDVTGGLLDDEVYWAYSDDDGKTWSDRFHIDTAWGPHAEASAPLTLLQDGSWATPITGFPTWEGRMTSRLCGRLLRTFDEGKTWSDDVVCMAFPGDTVTCYEQRMCQLADGTIVVIGWNEDTKTGARFNNHYTLSADNGRRFSAPRDTGIRGQASSLCPLGGMRLMSIHACRRDTDRPGIYGYIVDLTGGEWKIESETLLWKPDYPVVKDEGMAEIFSFLAFGQPSAILLQDGDLLLCFWYCEQGRYKTVARRFRL